MSGGYLTEFHHRPEAETQAAILVDFLAEVVGFRVAGAPVDRPA